MLGLLFLVTKLLVKMTVAMCVVFFFLGWFLLWFLVWAVAMCFPGSRPAASKWRAPRMTGLQRLF